MTADRSLSIVLIFQYGVGGLQGDWHLSTPHPQILECCLVAGTYKADARTLLN